MSLPPGLAPVAGPGAWGFTAPEAAEWVAGTLARGARLRDVAAREPGVRTLQGRGPVHVVPARGGGDWVLRPYRRGGLVARPTLGDRFLRAGTPRPLAEALASFEVRRRGIATPRVLGGAVYPAGLFYRADLLTEYIAGARDLATFLFRREAGEPDTTSTLRSAGQLLRSLAKAGIEHPDLNARNILLTVEEGGLATMLIDLDRCRLLPEGATAPTPRMLRRLERSLRKLATHARVTLTEGELDALRHAATSPV